MGYNYDFSGWATRNDIECSDGRTIRRNAFKEQNGETVPLVWNHQHNDASNVLGHAMLENRDEGVYAYCSLNDTPEGRRAKEQILHGDINKLSIYANKLKQKQGSVFHGVIREVSLVLSGANPGAYIDNVLMHGERCDDDAVIYNDEVIDIEPLKHSADSEDEEPEVDNTAKPNKEEKNKMAENNNSLNPEGKTVQEVYDSMTDLQKEAVKMLIGAAVQQAKNEKANDGGDENMKHNCFDSEYGYDEVNVLSHSDIVEIFEDAKRNGSLRESVLAHTDDYGIDNIDYLFPDAQNFTNAPEFIKRPDGWVQKVMSAFHKTPMSRVKTIFADITEDDARAKGYFKGNRKKDEVFTLLKRKTEPTMIYKKQKLDRQDIIDIKDFDVVAWLKLEMRGLLEEEIARAALVGDGRSSASDDKIDELNIRPIWTDDDLFSIKAPVSVAANATADVKAKQFIRTAIKARKDYRGSGNPTLYCTEELLTDMLLIEDNMGRVIYDTEEKLRTALRVREIVTVPVMEGLARRVGNATKNLMGIIVNLDDYNIGTDKGGEISMFEDFDIDFNQNKYLIETRCSGALVKPFSAIVLEESIDVTLTISPVDPETDMLGKDAGDLCYGVVVNDNSIEGTLNYVTGYTGYSGVPAEQEGNYLPISIVGAGADAVTTVTYKDRTVTVDSDNLALIRVTDKNEKLTIATTSGSNVITKVLSLRMLKLKK